MGTSKSSSGSPSGVPMVPPWVPDAPGENQDTQQEGDGAADQQSPPQRPPVPIAPPARFKSARTSLGRFARTGSTDDMRRGVGHYVRTGLGGSRSASRRLGNTVTTAGSLYGALSAVAHGQAPTPGSPLDPVLLSGRSAKEVMDAVVEAVRPVDGTQDSEANRDAVAKALGEVLDRYPDADLVNLSEEERLYAVEHYVALDVYNRLRLDVGRNIQDKAPSVSAALSRLREVKDYVKETVSASFRKLSSKGQHMNSRNVSQVVRAALQDALFVFEEYVR